MIVDIMFLSVLKPASISMTISKKYKILYWIFTLLFTSLILVSGIAELSRAPQIVQALIHLGYPLYLLKILGVAKILGVLAILYNHCKTLKEWAYAGFTLELIAAIVSHIFVGDSIEKVITPVVFLLLMAISYKYWKTLDYEQGKSSPDCV